MFKTLAIIRWALVAALVIVLAAPALAVSLGGRLIVEVDGASMTPTYQLGDVIVVREPTEADLVVGNVVTAIDGNGDYYTHRIETVNDDGSLGLKGDGNEASDPGTVTLEQLRGVVELHLGQPWASLVMQLQQWPLRICLLAVILGLALLPLGDRQLEPTPSRERAVRSRARRSQINRPGLFVGLAGGRRQKPAVARPAPDAGPSEARSLPSPSADTGAAGSTSADHIRTTVAAPGYAISVVDGADGQPRVRVSIDLDSSALAAALAVAAPSPLATAPAFDAVQSDQVGDDAVGSEAARAGSTPVHAEEVARPEFPSRSMSSVHVTAGATPTLQFTRPRGRRSRHGRRRAH